MSLKPAFVSGANAKILIANTNYIIAFASDVNFTVDVTVIPIEAIGKIEVITYEPVAYMASGSMNIMRYTGAMIEAAGLNKTADKESAGNATNDIAQNYAMFGAHLDPSKYMGSTTFDMEIHVKTQVVNPDGSATTSWPLIYTIMNCRLTRRGNALTKRGVMVDSYNFVATHVADASDNPSKVPTTNGTV